MEVRATAESKRNEVTTWFESLLLAFMTANMVGMRPGRVSLLRLFNVHNEMIVVSFIKGIMFWRNVLSKQQND